MANETPLLDNPDFLADLNSDTGSRKVAAKWGIAKSTVNKWRKTPPTPAVGAPQDSTEESTNGTKAVTAVRTRPVTLADAREWIASTGDNPDDYTLSIRSIAYGEGMFSNRMSAVPKPAKGKGLELDLPALYQAVQATEVRPRNVARSGRTTVVVWADMQLGKVSSRGGTKELLARLEEKRVALDGYLTRTGTDRTVFVDAGDPVEGFENVASQMFTNDLSLPQQVDIAATEMWKTLTLMAGFGPVEAVAVPSNHGAWRNGKQALGRPSDDWGLTIQERLKFQAELVGLPVTFHRPDTWDESVAVNVDGTVIGVHHGHQSPCDQMPKWWAGQQHGGQAVAEADILVTGHYHHLRVQPTGRSRRTGRSKWWLQAPTLDNGSDWYRNNQGDDSDPGLLVFQIGSDGFDLQSLSVL